MKWELGLPYIRVVAHTPLQHPHFPAEVGELGNPAFSGPPWTYRFSTDCCIDCLIYMLNEGSYIDVQLFDCMAVCYRQDQIQLSLELGPIDSLLIPHFDN